RRPRRTRGAADDFVFRSLLEEEIRGSMTQPKNWIAIFALGAFVIPASAETAPAAALRPFDYDYSAEAARASRLNLDSPDPAELRGIFAERRRRVLQAMPAGAMLIFSVEQAQPRRLEFQVPHSENHDFIFLTGVEGFDSLDSAILLVPTAEKNWTVLYTGGD